MNKCREKFHLSMEPRACPLECPIDGETFNDDGDAPQSMTRRLAFADTQGRSPLQPKNILHNSRPGRKANKPATPSPPT